MNLSSKDIRYLIVLRILGVILFALSLAEFYIGTRIREYIYSSFGAYYVAVFSIIAGIASMLSINIATVIVACVFSIFSVLVGIVGAALDGIGTIVFGSIEGCIDNQFIYSPSSPSYNTALYKAENIAVCTPTVIQNYNPSYCYCISSFNSTVIITADGSQKELSGCWLFDLNDDTLNCNGFVSNLPTYLKESAALVGIIIFFSLILAIVSCINLCYPKRQPENILVVNTLNQPLQGHTVNTI